MATKPTTMLVTSIKDEGPNILEWVAYHRVIGFDVIQVYQNDSTDDTQKTLRTLQRVGAIEYCRNPSRKQQWQNKAYRRASFSEDYTRSDWCMALDGDEFLNIKTGSGQVRDLIASCPDADSIIVNWRNFGSSAHIDLSDDLVMSRFTAAEPESDIQSKRPCGFKSLFKTSSYRRPGIHRAKEPAMDHPVIVNGSGLGEDEFVLKNWRSFDPQCRKFAQVNHYPIRDLSSFLIKSARGSSSHLDREVGEKYWSRFDRNDEQDLSIFRHRNAVHREMDRLNDLSDGRLYKLRKQSAALWQDKLNSMYQDPSVMALRNSILNTMPPTHH